MNSRTDWESTHLQAISLELPVYVHTRHLTSSQDAGIQKVVLDVILGKRKGHWYIDQLTLTDLLPYINRGQSLMPVAESLMELIHSKGYNPNNIKGWARYFRDNGGSRLRQALDRYV